MSAMLVEERQRNRKKEGGVEGERDRRKRNKEA